MNVIAELMRVGDPATSVVEYTPTALALATLRDKYRDARYDVATTSGMEQAKEARRELRGYRIALEKKRAEIKAPALERCKQIDSEARRITAALEALEDPIDAQIKVEEQRKENEKAAREHAERTRIARNMEVIDDIRNLPLLSLGKSATSIAETIKLLRDDKPDVDDDFAVAADEALQKVLASLESMYAEKFGVELEAKHLADERAELDRRRAETDRIAQAERDCIAVQQRQIDADRAELRMLQKQQPAQDQDAELLPAPNVKPLPPVTMTIMRPQIIVEPTHPQGRVIDLAIRRADEATRSDIECLCSRAESDANGIPWYDITTAPDYYVAEAVEYLTLRGRIERHGDLVRVAGFDA